MHLPVPIIAKIIDEPSKIGDGKLIGYDVVVSSDDDDDDIFWRGSANGSDDTSGDDSSSSDGVEKLIVFVAVRIFPKNPFVVAVAVVTIPCCRWKLLAVKAYVLLDCRPIVRSNDHTNRRMPYRDDIIVEYLFFYLFSSCLFVFICLFPPFSYKYS